MNILVINAGSSSTKYYIFNNEKILSQGKINKNLTKIFKANKIDVIGHRIVHGGPITKSTIINQKVQNQIKKYQQFTPLHKNFIDECKFFKVPQVAVFDTAFHQTLPEIAYTYPIKNYCKYGFHGISHQYISLEAKKILGKNKKIISCHLGSGSSITAIKNGKSIDTSMGFTPLSGLISGTRCGDIDPGLILHLSKKIKNVDNLLNYKSGLLAIGGSSDMRVLLKSKNKKAKLAIDIYCYQAAKYIGSYIAALKGVDAIIFTGGIGQNSAKIRNKIMSYFNNLKVLVIPTNEDLMIAREVLKVIQKQL